MKIVIYPNEEQKREICQRPMLESTNLHSIVSEVIESVKQNGDQALLEMTKRFDGVELSSVATTKQEWNEEVTTLSFELRQAILVAKENISKFHSSQITEKEPVVTTKGVVCWQKAVAIEKVGLYIPGGTAPLFSTVLMLAIPALIAGCKEIVLCTPPNKKGKIHPAILYAAKVSGVTQIFKVGGAQAIAAMAYGTETIPHVYKIFGPGNQYVTAAKQLVSLGQAAIDMPAGPSEVMVIADENANPAFVAADFLSQAEHGGDSQSILLSTNQSIIEAVNREIESQLKSLSRGEYLEKSLNNSKLVLLKDEKELVDLMNQYAPEHLIIQTKEYEKLASKVINAGSVFLGAYTPESAGDYASGTNHTLPTNGYAKAYSGVNLDSFVKKITFQHISAEGLLGLGETIETMAEAEQLTAHKNAVSIRLKQINND